MNCASPILIWALCVGFVTVAIVAMTGCESTATDVDGEFVQSPIGYMPPLETQQQVPIQIGPKPVPLIGGTPSIRLPEQAPAIELTATETGFEPAEIVVAPGQVVTVRLTNRSNVDRGLRVELPAAHASLPQDVAPGESRIIVFNAPAQPGAYVFHSSSTGEGGQRLEGRLIVRESSPN